MKLILVKGSNRASEAGFCCLCRRPEETHSGQRQQSRLKKQDFAASAEDPMKPTMTKGSNIVSQARFCCLCQRPDETRFGQRQQYCHASRILLPLPKTQRNAPRSKAANTPRKQDFAASAEDPMKPAKPKGSNHTSEARFCRHCRRPDETHQDQRRQYCLASKFLLLPT